ncbi:hypothetical protein [Atlantibacter hermannii]|uniref:hypothetical protein n=1 Tax=Atlantibacter hermannii TaxID=565 RepID=UPI001C706ACF|nr:hypothetical protein [Atlantibacter hermannii]
MTQTLTTTDELKHLASSDNTNELTRSLARECLANREAQPVYQCRFFTTDVDGKQIGEWQDMDKGFYEQYDPYCRRILYTAPPAPAVLECFLELLKHADGMAMGTDWNSGTAAKYHRTKLCEAVEACRAAMLAAAPEGGNEK